MFQIPEFTAARVASITNRVEKHGDDEKPAVSLSLEIDAANTILDQIDPKIREALFKPKPDETPELPDIEQVTPVLRCNSIERVTLPTKYEGWTLRVDGSIDEGDPMSFGGVKVDKLSVEPKQGGSIVLRLRVGTSDVDAERLGWLGMHNGEDIWITLTPPKKQPEAIDGTGEEFRREHPETTAEDLFTAGGPEDDTDTDGGDLDASSGQASKDALEASGNNPFGRVPQDADADRAWAFDPERAEPAPQPAASTRTARGRAATKKALAEGLAAAQAAGAA